MLASNTDLANEARKLVNQTTDQIPATATIDRALLALLDNRVDISETILRQGLKRNALDTSLLNDIAVVDLMRAENGDSAALIDALDTLERCLHIHPKLKEALFNRAIALEHLGLRASARDAWLTYVKFESDKSWIQRAREHLADGEKPSLEEEWNEKSSLLEEAARLGDSQKCAQLVALYPQPTRAFVQENLLNRWAVAYLSGDRRAAGQYLSTARSISNILLRYNSERSAADAVTEIETAQIKGLGIEVAHGYVSLQEGLRAYQALRPQAAIPLLRRAQTAFEVTKAQSLLLWTHLWLAGSKYYLGQRRIAEAEIEALVSSPVARKYPALQGRALWSRGLMMLVRSDLSASLRSFQASLGEFVRLGELENVGSLQALIAENLNELGEKEKPWQMRALALKNLSSFPSSVRLHNLLSEAADKLVSSGLPNVAQYFHTEDLQVSRRIGNPASIAEALLSRSRDHFAIGHLEMARADALEARKYIAEIINLPTRERMQAEAHLVTGEFAGVNRAKEAIDDLSAALIYYERSNIPSIASFARLLRARAFLLLHQDLQAEVDLKIAINSYELVVGSINELASRASYRARWQSVFDEVIDIETLQGNPDVAFKFIEYARSGRWSTVLSVTTLSHRLEPGDALVEYALLPRKLLIWIISRNSSTFVVRELETSRLKSIVEKFANELQRSLEGANLKNLSHLLFQILVQPVIDRVPDSKRLILITDRCLAEIPFSALLDRTSGHYLIETRSLIYEPSALRVLATAATRTAVEERSVSKSLLAVGGTTPDPKSFPHLENLRSAAAEAQGVADLYPRKEILLGSQATRSNFLKLMKKATIVHFAGHAILDGEEPLSSRILLTPVKDSDQDCSISGQELSRMDLHHLHMFILSACDTAARGVGNRDGLPGLVDALLGANVSQVVAALWRVPDEESRIFFVTFHKHLLSAKRADEALQSVQVQAIKKNQRPNFWAAFELFGDV